MLWRRLRAKVCLRRCSCLRQGRRSRCATERRPEGCSQGQAEFLRRHGVSTWLSWKQSQTLVVTWHYPGSWRHIRKITDMSELNLCRGAHKVCCFGCRRASLRAVMDKVPRSFVYIVMHSTISRSTALEVGRVVALILVFLSSFSNPKQRATMLDTISINGKWTYTLLKRSSKGDRYTPREAEGLKAQWLRPSFCFSPWFCGGGVKLTLDDLFKRQEGRKWWVTSVRVGLGGLELRFWRWETMKDPRPSPNKHLISPSRFHVLYTPQMSGLQAAWNTLRQFLCFSWAQTSSLLILWFRFLFLG